MEEKIVFNLKHIDQDLINSLAKEIDNQDEIIKLSEFFKIFADPTRIKILKVLAVSELCVCNITQLLGMKQPAISHQLRVLRQANLVKFRKSGKTVYYSLADSHIESIITQGTEHVNE